jgi:hypothetical protein
MPINPAHTFGPLTADDIAAFKLAETVVFTVNGRTGSRMRLGIESAREGNVFTAREQRLFQHPDRAPRGRERELNVSAHVNGYKDGTTQTSWYWNTDHDSWSQAPECFYMSHSAKYDHALQTVIASLRVGETLRLNWTADNNNDHVREAGLHVDQLELVVALPEREGTPRRFRTYRITTAVCADNTARMIHRHGF